jgi:hypothetical protein
MRRYFIRFAVAVLTFVVGVALSLALGIFKPNTQNGGLAFQSRRGCGKRFMQPPRVVAEGSGSRVMSIENTPDEPLRLSYVSTESTAFGDSEKRMVRFLVENSSSLAVESYSVQWKSSSGSNEREHGFIVTGRSLQPGASEVITVTRNAADSMWISIYSITFSNGSKWNNPKEFKFN